MSKSKKRSFLIVLVSLVLLVFTVSCNSETPVPSAAQPVSGSASANDSLVYYYISKDYKMSESQVETALSDTLGLVGGTSATLTRQSSHDYEMSCGEGTKGEPGEYSLTFYDYEIQSEGQGVRHALVTDDRRVGPVLCVVEGELDTSMFFIDAFMEAAGQYADSIGESWSAITEDDVSAFMDKYSGGTENSKVVSGFYISEVEADPGYNFESTVLASQWHQSYPFNMAVRMHLGHDYPVGCANLGIAMICCYHRFPESISNTSMLDGLKQSMLGSWWSGWNGTIAWDTIRSIDSRTNGWNVINDEPSDSDQRIAVGSLSAFLLECGLNTNSVYGTSGTGTDVLSILNNLTNMGYTMSSDGTSYGGKVYEWSFDNVHDSLINNYPVLCYDMNHMFIVDGLKRGTCKLYPILGWYVADDPIITFDAMRFVHMNFGWGPRGGNGWYDENVVAVSLDIIAENADPSDYGYPKVPYGLILNLRPNN